MENPKVLAYRYSNELAGTEMKQQQVELLDSKPNENGRIICTVKTNDGIVCNAIFNPFTCCYYADDVYGVIEDYKPRKVSDTEM